MSSFNGHMKEYKHVAIDAFASLPDKNAYFLSHFHTGTGIF